MSKFEIRPYTLKDYEAVIKLLELNIPEYFHLSEKEDFKKYLEEEIEDYFIVKGKDLIIGAGGINYFKEQKLARISWDMVHPNVQGQGVGRKLVEHRINHLNNQTGIDVIIVRTTQLVYKFYEKMNFKIRKIEKDFWAKGFDLYEMELLNANSKL